MNLPTRSRTVALLAGATGILFLSFQGTRHDSSAPPAPSAKGPAALSLPPLMPVISFNENPVNHNMHITSDGDFYYTINGGSSGSGQIQQFDAAGNLVGTYPVTIDGRGIAFNAADGKLWISTFGGNIVRIDNLSAGVFTTVFSSVMQNGQASFAISADGTRFYDFSQGTLYVRDMMTGAALDTLTGLSCGSGNYGGEAAVAVDANYIYTWNAASLTVYRYDTLGALVQTFTLSNGDNGHSLSCANGLLFVSKDGNYSTGTWYGYDLSVLLGTPPPSAPAAASLHPNPAHDRVYIDDPSVRRVQVVSLSGGRVFEKSLAAGERTVVLPALPAGMYIAVCHTDGGAFPSKLFVR